MKIQFIYHGKIGNNVMKYSFILLIPPQFAKVKKPVLEWHKSKQG